MWSEMGCFWCMSRHSKGESGACIMSKLWHAGRMIFPRMYHKILVNERDKSTGRVKVLTQRLGASVIGC